MRSQPFIHGAFNPTVILMEMQDTVKNPNKIVLFNGFGRGASKQLLT